MSLLDKEQCKTYYLVIQPINEEALHAAALDDLVLVPGALPRSTCEALIARIERTGFRAMSGAYPPAYRDNDRCVLDSEALAGRLFALLHHHLPPEVTDPLGPVYRVALSHPCQALKLRAEQQSPPPRPR